MQKTFQLLNIDKSFEVSYLKDVIDGLSNEEKAITHLIEGINGYALVVENNKELMLELLENSLESSIELTEDNHIIQDGIERKERIIEIVDVGGYFCEYLRDCYA